MCKENGFLFADYHVYNKIVCSNWRNVLFYVDSYVTVTGWKQTLHFLWIIDTVLIWRCINCLFHFRIYLTRKIFA